LENLWRIYQNAQCEEHIKIATASPQANGQVEKINRTILPMIAKLADERSVQWHCVLGDVEFACNNTISKTANECPSILLFGMQQRDKVVDELRDANCVMRIA